MAAFMIIRRAEPGTETWSDSRSPAVCPSWRPSGQDRRAVNRARPLTAADEDARSALPDAQAGGPPWRLDSGDG